MKQVATSSHSWTTCCATDREQESNGKAFRRQHALHSEQHTTCVMFPDWDKTLRWEQTSDTTHPPSPRLAWQTGMGGPLYAWSCQKSGVGPHPWPISGWHRGIFRGQPTQPHGSCWRPISGHRVLFRQRVGSGTLGCCCCSLHRSSKIPRFLSVCFVRGWMGHDQRSAGDFCRPMSPLMRLFTKPFRRYKPCGRPACLAAG